MAIPHSFWPCISSRSGLAVCYYRDLPPASTKYSNTHRPSCNFLIYFERIIFQSLTAHQVIQYPAFRAVAEKSLQVSSKQEGTHALGALPANTHKRGHLIIKRTLLQTISPTHTQRKTKSFKSLRTAWQSTLKPPQLCKRAGCRRPRPGRRRS